MPDSPNNARSELWTLQGLKKRTPAYLFQLVLLGSFIGLLGGSIISVFVLLKDMSFNSLLVWMSPGNREFLSIAMCAAFTFCSALIVCWAVKNPALRLGGESWIMHAIAYGQNHVWAKILYPKFISILLVLGCGISVGSEGPSIQMGAAAALGMKRFAPGQYIERRFFILAGCAAGLAAAFCAPFSGVCYVYEVMKEKISKSLLTFLLSSSFGVYIACFMLFRRGTLLPMPTFYMPDLAQLWILLPLALAGSLTGICYNLLLKNAIRFSSSQKLIPTHWLPMFAFTAAFLMVLYFPEISGEGLDIFPTIFENKTTWSFLLVFLICKLLFTAYCYGTFIPAGEMVPLLCVGGVTGTICFDFLQMLLGIDPQFRSMCMAMCMAGAFASAEHAPLTAVVLVAEMCGSWGISHGLLFAAATGYFMARFLRILSFRKIFKLQYNAIRHYLAIIP